MRQLLKPARASQAAAAGAASAAAAEVIAPPPEMDPAAAAFFDVDNTLMRGASIYHFARGREDSEHIDAVRQSALAFVADHKVADIIELGEQIYDETMARRIWQGTRDLALRHLAAGERVWLVTATPVELANILSSRLGLTGALGTVAETRDGVYTGALAGGLLHGEAKAAAVRALAAREDLDLALCSAYSDSANDLPMLQLVGHPHVVNPDSRLLAEARQRGWPVHDFRSGRRATLIALPVAAGLGALAGGIVAAAALKRRRAR